MSMMTACVQSGFEPIPGYVLRERLGSGGYGDVWLADAPGGLRKAIKFVHGNIDGEKAAHELKALQRIRQVNHPFILSLERIEVIEGQLIIVTELAQGSLHDRFLEFRQRGFVGITRDRLLNYLSDAADGLDFLCQQHDLQHLDVKPGNLLLVADRVKVADFGLIKDVQSNSMSMMGGLTPTYAAPEMFDGRPGRFSDQYSLAIVYQELLTGTLPFRGRTTAQLANEHLHKAPNLEALPLIERPIVAKALSKKPQMRFSDCREFIAALRNANHVQEKETPKQATAPTRSRSNESSNSTANPQAGKVVPRNEIRLPSVPTDNQGRSDEQSPPRSIVLLPELAPIEAEDSQAELELPINPSTDGNTNTSRTNSDTSFGRRTLYLGLGGTGAEALAAMRDRIAAGPLLFPSQLDVGWLLIDTDESAIQRAVDPERENKLSYSSALLLKLNSPKHYRQSQTPFYPQISRRWVYNIPRSLKTDGVRPLGMLAFLDNAIQCYETIGLTLSELVEDDRDGQREEPITVYIFASAHGGTGSALANEIAYLIRQIGACINVPIHIELLLTCAVPNASTPNDLPAASALACLMEINHYYRTGGLHSSIESIPESQAVARPPYDDVNLVYGGRFGDRIAWRQAVHQAADYAWNCATTELGKRLRLSRQRDREAAGRIADRSWDDWLSTISTKTFEHDHDPTLVAANLCLNVVQPWIAPLVTVETESATTSSGSSDAPLSSRNAVADPKIAERIEFMVGDLFRNNRWTAQAWVRECMVHLVPDDTPRKPASETAHPSDALTHTEPKPASSSNPELQLSSDQMVELEQICEQLAVSTDDGWNAVVRLMGSSRQKLFDWLLTRWLVDVASWQNLTHVLKAISAKFTVNANSLLVAAQRIGEKHDAILDKLYSSQLVLTPELSQQLDALALEARFHSIASKILTRLSIHLQHLDKLSSNDRVTHRTELFQWATSLSSRLGLSSPVRSNNTSAVPLQPTHQDPNNKLVRDLLVKLAAERLSHCWGIGSTDTVPESFNGIFDKISAAISDEKNVDSNKSTSNTLMSSGGTTGDHSLTSTHSVLEKKSSCNALDNPLTGSTSVHRSSANTDAISASKRDALYHSDLAGEIDRARPYLVEFGGAIQNILVLPNTPAGQLDNAELSQVKDKQATIIQHSSGVDCSIICIAQQLSLSDIINRVWMPTPDLWQLAGRLLARVDVDWLPIE